MPEIKKLVLDDPATKSADIVAGNVDALKALFPDAFKEGGIDFDVLRQLLGGAVDEKDEKYGLNWHGKRKARQIALTPSTGTLLPCPDESVDWDTTQNLMIEGDNLEVLKLLQKSYAGKVNLIYIDPPYNTGSDFVYPDNFKDTIKNYQEITGQVGDDGTKITSNTEASGRFHTDWINMIYPRLRAAKSLLSRDGFLFISIDNNEVHNLKAICSEIFGEENFRNAIVVRRGIKNVQAQFDDISDLSSGHEYILCYSKQSTTRMPLLSHEMEETQAGKWDTYWRGTDRHTMRYELFGQKPETGQWRWSEDRSLKARRNYEHFLENYSQTMSLDEYFLEHKQSTNVELDFVRLNDDGVVQYYVSPRDFKLISDNWMDITVKGNYIGFDTEKHVGLMKRIVGWIAGPNDLVLDFFAGSGSTGHATYELNVEKKTNRRFILVQLQEPTPSKEYNHLAELTRIRLKKASDELRTANGKVGSDLGFRVFKLAQSNIVAWEPEPSDLEGTLLANTEHLVPGRTEQDVLYELLLKLGLDLCVPIEKKNVSGKTVHSIGGGALIVCLADGLATDTVESVANGIIVWWKELSPAVDTRVVFKDSGFADDVAKANMAAILNQNGILDVRSL
jgi:adenine-specific DNA-methyltransferase